MDDEGSLHSASPLNHRRLYDEQMHSVRAAFDRDSTLPAAGQIAIAARAALVDTLVQTLWTEVLRTDAVFSSAGLAPHIALVAVGGYGRSELFPFSDVDLMFLHDASIPERSLKEPVRRLNQMLWDSGLRVSAMTRTFAECERFDPENVEFTLSLLDARPVSGDPRLSSRLLEETLPRLLTRERKKIVARLLEVTRTRHARYGDTLFHLEPNIKECPGGLRDAHVCSWLARLRDTPDPASSPDFLEARHFLLLVRAFLHFRHGRDDNTLDWQTQDEAAATPLGPFRGPIDASYWMRFYFRHARTVERRVAQSIEEAVPAKPASRLPTLASLRKAEPPPGYDGFSIESNRIVLNSAPGADTPELAFAVFAAMARTGASLSRTAEARLEHALLTAGAEDALADGASVWRHLQAILTGCFAGRALRAMHALGILELLIPEFHGIDALVIRDAYHRYTVDEHTFVLVDTLHALRPPANPKSALPPDPKAAGFASILRDLPHPALLLLAALLHDTGKGHSTSGHAHESARMAEDVLLRLKLDRHQAALVLDLIRNHLEMSAALRRDVFDTETIRAFAARVQTPEALRMLTLFTYADICAVHPDALTPWKAENLWRLHIATANFLDRHLDEERVSLPSGTQPPRTQPATQLTDLIQAMRALPPALRSPVDAARLARFLDGFPLRYLQTRSPEQIRLHADMAARLLPAAPDPPAQPADTLELDFRFAPSVSELTLVTRDRPMLFASMAGALAAWGMNIVTADAFSNAHSVIVDTFRFTDVFRTLELNESERTRFVVSVRDVLSGAVPVEPLLAARRRARRRAPKTHVETRVDFDASASAQSTILQVIAQDTPGLLRALSLTLAQASCNIEVALIDTEGEMAIDVFYLTQSGAKLDPPQQDILRRILLEAIELNAR